MCRAFSRLERDVACEALRDNHIYNAFSNIVPLNEAVIFEKRKVALAQNLSGFTHLLEPFDFLDADIQQADGWPLDIEEHARHGAAHDSKVDEMGFIGADRCADIQNDGLSFERRPKRSDRRTFDAFDHF